MQKQAKGGALQTLASADNRMDILSAEMFQAILKKERSRADREGNHFSLVVMAALKPEEKASFDKETVTADYRIFIDHADVASVTSYLIEENRINVPTGDVVIASGNYDITAVQGFQMAGHKHYEVYLHKEKN